MPSWLIFVFIGLIGGVAAGIFGLGGGLIVVPALVYWAEFSQNLAIGTTFAILLRPIGLAAAMFFGTCLGAYFAHWLDADWWPYFIEHTTSRLGRVVRVGPRQLSEFSGRSDGGYQEKPCDRSWPVAEVQGGAANGWSRPETRRSGKKLDSS